MTVYIIEWQEFYGSKTLAVVSDQEIVDLVVASYIEEKNRELEKHEQELRDMGYVEDEEKLLDEIKKEADHKEYESFKERHLREIEERLSDRWEIVDDEERPHTIAELRTAGESLSLREFKLNQYKDRLFI